MPTHTTTWRLLAVGIFLTAAVLVGCTFNRTAPLLSNTIPIEDSANGNHLETLP